jgi:hypothetical protein
MRTINVRNTWVLSSSRIREILSEAFPHAAIWLLDSKYWCTSLFLTKFLLAHVDSTNLKKYIRDRFDCDDFALTLMSLWRLRFGLNSMFFATGKTPFGAHAYNVVIATPDNYGFEWKAYLVEPQTDGVWTPAENEKRFHYDTQFIMG